VGGFAVADELFLELFDFVKFAFGGGLFDFAFDDEFALGDFGRALGFKFGDFPLLRVGQFDAGRALVQTLHGKFVGAFHKKSVRCQVSSRLIETRLHEFSQEQQRTQRRANSTIRLCDGLM
jgi:hypothetical protein